MIHMNVYQHGALRHLLKCPGRSSHYGWASASTRSLRGIQEEVPPAGSPRLYRCRGPLGYSGVIVFLSASWSKYFVKFSAAPETFLFCIMFFIAYSPK